MACPAPMKATSNGAFQGDDPLHFALPLLILQICLVIVLTRALAYILKPIRQPRVIAEIIVSVLLRLSINNLITNYFYYIASIDLKKKKKNQSFIYYVVEIHKYIVSVYNAGRNITWAVSNRAEQVISPHGFPYKEHDSLGHHSQHWPPLLLVSRGS